MGDDESCEVETGTCMNSLLVLNKSVDGSMDEMPQHTKLFVILNISVNELVHQMPQHINILEDSEIPYHQSMVSFNNYHCS